MIGRRNLLLAALASPLPAAGMQARAADAFVDSAGVCTHLSSEPYASAFDTVRRRVGALGVRYLRDELRPDNDLARWQELHRRFGIRSHWLVSPATNSVPEMLRTVAALGPETVAAIEGQNEGDSDWFMAQRQARPRWDLAVVAYQRAVFRALRREHPAIPVLSPSIIDYRPADAGLIRGAAPYCDIVAIHPYAQGAQEPETPDDYAALDWYLRHMRDPFKPGAPVMATEAGYTTLAQTGGVSEAVAGAYLPRLLLHHFAAGVRRTFLYELMDGGDDPGDSEHHFGLLRPDGSPKPAYDAIRILLSALADPGPRFTPGRLKIALGDDARAVLLQKRDGVFYLALWRAERSWDPAAARDRAVPPRPVEVRVGQPVTSAAVLRLDSADWSPLPAGPGRLSVPVGSSAVLLRLAA